MKPTIPAYFGDIRSSEKINSMETKRNNDKLSILLHFFPCENTDELVVKLIRDVESIFHKFNEDIKSTKDKKIETEKERYHSQKLIKEFEIKINGITYKPIQIVTGYECKYCEAKDYCNRNCILLLSGAKKEHITGYTIMSVKPESETKQ